MSPVIYALIALAVGLVAGWFIGGRPAADLRARLAAAELELKDLDEKFRRAITDLAGASERANRADDLAKQLDETRRETVGITAELATLREKSANFEEQKALLLQSQEALKKEFEAAGAKVLGQAQEAFLQRAVESFKVSEDKNEARIKALLDPVGQKLKSYEDQVLMLEKQRSDAFSRLDGQINLLREGQDRVHAEAARLGNSLRNAPKARGRWGEQQLRNVLEQCGLAEHTDFVTEHSIDTDEGRLRPDAIVRIPGNKLLVIDAKVSLNDYQDAFEASDEKVRDVCLDRHVASMRNHIQTLSAKNYQSQFDEAPDYVLMFVPGEHFIAAALEHDAKRRTAALGEDALLRSTDLWNFAFERRVLLASPTNLVAIARTISQVWRQDGLAHEAKEIGKLGGELFDRLAKALEDLAKVGTNLGRAVGSYNDFTRSFESRVLVSARKLKDKHIEIGKREIAEVPLVEAQPRYTDGSEVTALPAANDEDAA
jgi:DNA recombination protein RmuC